MKHAYVTNIKKVKKIIKSRLNKDGFALVDAMVAFVLLTLIVILFTGFMSTAIRTAPIIESDAEDHHATMVAIAQALAKTSTAQDVSHSFHAYVPTRSLTEPNKIKIYNNYDKSTGTMRGESNHVYEVLSKNIIPSSSLMVSVHPTSSKWVQSVKTSKLKGSTFSFEPIKGIGASNTVPTNKGFYSINRVEPDKNRLKTIETLNYPKNYGENEVMIYENAIK